MTLHRVDSRVEDGPAVTGAGNARIAIPKIMFDINDRGNLTGAERLELQLTVGRRFAGEHIQAAFGHCPMSPQTPWRVRSHASFQPSHRWNAPDSTLSRSGVIDGLSIVRFEARKSRSFRYLYGLPVRM